ncbi:hypothetical protein [Marinobacter sp. bablab_jr008]|uniref:hypothetical protein n=1 Tax=Marinobacter sp. bablab_jr008 TaxID=2755064 RepID=UPI0018F258AF|nr:hypothetical protein [Marinobacter sp. bablab_jr008]MEC9385592.1 hypothetical protein [Pseudomonadota bacterium]
MKWLAFLLAALNLAVWFVPAWIEPSRYVGVSSGTLPRVSSLKVVSDTMESPSREEGCLRITLGMFDARDDAESVAAGLKYKAGIVEVEKELPPLHWVLIPPQPPEVARAQFRELYLQGVESYIVSRGEYRNAISLGLFESLEAAQSVMAEKKQANLNVVLAKFPRNRLGYALVFEVESMAESEWVQAVEAKTGYEFDFVESNACEGVARPEKNP